MKEIVLACYDDNATNPNVMRQQQAEVYAVKCLNERLVSAAGVVAEVVRVKDVQLRPEGTSPSRGLVVGLCEHVGMMKQEAE